MKNKYIIFLVIIGIVSIFTAGCGTGAVGLNDINEFKDVKKENIIKIDVYWDDYGALGKYIEFLIDERNAIDDIMDILLKPDTFAICDGFNDGGGGYINLIGADDTKTEVGLFQFQAGTIKYRYNNQDLQKYIEKYGKENNLMKQYFSIYDLASALGKSFFKDIAKIEVGWQTADEYEESAMVYFDITEKEAISYILVKLGDKKAFVRIENAAEKKNFTFIAFHNAEGQIFKVNISKDGTPRLVDGEVQSFIQAYGTERGYLS